MQFAVRRERIVGPMIVYDGIGARMTPLQHAKWYLLIKRAEKTVANMLTYGRRWRDRCHRGHHCTIAATRYVKRQTARMRRICIMVRRIEVELSRLVERLDGDFIMQHWPSFVRKEDGRLKSSWRRG